MRVLDLFCGAGGAAVGYARAGFEVVGVDIVDQPNYPFEFIQADATNPPVDLADFDLIHASPPCQHFTRYRNVHKDITERYEDLIEPTRALLQGSPYIIENVPNAPIRKDVELCGSMFGLDVRRHRWFELGGWDASKAPTCNHNVWVARPYKSSTGRKRGRFTCEVGSWDEPLEVQKRAMGVDWPIEVRELSEAIPPAYTYWLGHAFREEAGLAVDRMAV